MDPHKKIHSCMHFNQNMKLWVKLNCALNTLITEEVTEAPWFTSV